MVLSTILQKKAYPKLQLAVFPQERIGARAVVRADSGVPVIGAVREIKTKRVYEDGQWQPVEWARMEIPGVGMRWIPASYFICWTW
jgi:hypothetical protein